MSSKTLFKKHSTVFFDVRKARKPSRGYTHFTCLNWFRTLSTSCSASAVKHAVQKGREKPREGRSSLRNTKYASPHLVSDSERREATSNITLLWVASFQSSSFLVDITNAAGVILSERNFVNSAWLPAHTATNFLKIAQHFCWLCLVSAWILPCIRMDQRRWTLLQVRSPRAC